MTQEPIPYPEHTGSLCQQKMSVTVRTKQVSTVLVPSEQVWAPSAAFSPSATANGALQNQNDTQCHSHLEITKRSQTHDLLCWFALLIDFICNPLTKWCKFQGLFHVFNCSKRKSVRRKLERWQEARPREILLPRQGTDVRRHLGSRYSKVWSSGWLWQRQLSSLY